VDRQRRLPSPLIADVAAVLCDYHTHAQIDNIFKRSGAPGAPPAGNKLLTSHMPTRSRARHSPSGSDSDPEIANLYALPLAEFTPARNALAARLRQAGQADEAEAVRALKKHGRAPTARRRGRPRGPSCVRVRGGFELAEAALRDAPGVGLTIDAGRVTPAPRTRACHGG
jgi:hypothetical protein